MRVIEKNTFLDVPGASLLEDADVTITRCRSWSPTTRSRGTNEFLWEPQPVVRTPAASAEDGVLHTHIEKPCLARMRGAREDTSPRNAAARRLGSTSPSKEIAPPSSPSTCGGYGGSSNSSANGSSDSEEQRNHVTTSRLRRRFQEVYNLDSDSESDSSDEDSVSAGYERVMGLLTMSDDQLMERIKTDDKLLDLIRTSHKKKGATPPKDIPSLIRLSRQCLVQMTLTRD
eukprot:TRINITY_DN7417_c0_g1_i3.p1 TRINITY_DN7417_c0_g1~~TRINITY_DN7417_c0_g1_i3.p1  ORF type:complete len:230 (-),score=28.08 TRINITY_DN7417_c0_g1_i3:195-884(-)